MERVKLYLREVCRGEIVLDSQGSRTEVRAVMEDPGDGLYRAVLSGRNGELTLGVLAPEGGVLEVRRMLYQRDIASLGELLRGEARCSFHFQETCWKETGRPAELFHSAFLVGRLHMLERGWWRREKERLYLALPLAEDQPFPLETLFCLARVELVEGRRCAVFVFQGEEPVEG